MGSKLRNKTYEEAYGSEKANLLKHLRTTHNKNRTNVYTKEFANKISKTRKEKFLKEELVCHNKDKIRIDKDNKIKYVRPEKLIYYLNLGWHKIPSWNDKIKCQHCNSTMNYKSLKRHIKKKH